jgi:hypothetical protein
MTGLLSVASLAVFLCSCASIQVGSDYDRSASFAGYHTFAWMVREHHGSSNPLTAQRAQDAIEAELTRRGFVHASDPAGADFIVDFTIGAHDRMDVQSFPEPYYGPYWSYPGWWRPYWGSTLDVRTYREGTLSIDVFDGRTHRPVWHGWARKDLTRSDTEHSEGPIRHAVRSVLADFPPH